MAGRIEMDGGDCVPNSPMMLGAFFARETLVHVFFLFFQFRGKVCPTGVRDFFCFDCR